jgi:LacI family transcriptional regulator
MLEAVEAKARSLGYHLIVSSSLEGVTPAGRVDGTIILGSPENVPLTAPANRQPAVYVFNADGARAGLVAWSDEEGMFLATTHLLDLGHRHMAALLCYGEEKAPPHPKVRGFRRAIRESGATAWECWDAPRSDVPLSQGEQYDAGCRAVQRLLGEGARFTAIVARNDFLALGALRALREAGLQVPHDVSLVGYTDSIQALCSDPPLTSVRTPIAAAGEIAVEQLARLIRQPDGIFAGALLPTTLSIRQSSAPPA